MRFYEIPETLVEDHKQFEKDINEFITGEMNPVKFKAIRVAQGVYEQRQNDTYMIRIRCAACGITPRQLRKVAEVAEKYGNGEVHFTTRSEVQIHDVLIQNLMTVMKELRTVDLSSRGGGGNTIRNILTSPDSGVSKDEVFDVDPYAMALTSRMIHEADSWNLPRKFKIAFSNSKKDTAYTQTTCLGFVAAIKNGQKGFEVYVAGGMGARPMVGSQLLDFVPDTKIYQVTKALKVMFDKHGNRRSKHTSRIKFLWKKLEKEEFVRLFREEYDKIKDDASLDLVPTPIENSAKKTDLPVIEVKGVEFDTWKRRYVTEQKQPGLAMIKLPLRLGDLFREDADKLCDFLENFGENTIRCDRDQNIRLRNVPEKYLGNLFTVIKSMKQTLADKPAFLGNMINCTGAQTCKLGICLPRGLSDAIRDRLSDSRLDLDAIADFHVNMSGCPNTCGMHHIADLGFFGKIGRKGSDMYPAYNVLAGAKHGVAGETQYAEKVDEIPAKHIPDFVHDFLDSWIDRKKKGAYPTYNDYLEAEGKALIKTLCDKYRDVPEYDGADESKAFYYKDWGAKRKLSLDELGTAECSAGMFDMINVDRKAITDFTKELQDSADAAREKELLYNIVFHTSRMLLVTRGLDAKDETQAIELFSKHFAQTELVNPKYQDLLVLGKLGLKDELAKHKPMILEMANEVEELYKGMDDSLRFKTQKKAEEKPEADVLNKDFRGVACPMNFVKTKLALEPMAPGAKLQILLDDGEPIRNVPNSVKLEGHKIVEQAQLPDGHWRVLIEKKK